MKQRKPMWETKLKIIAVSGIQPHSECGAAGICDDVTGIEDAILLSDYA